MNVLGIIVSGMIGAMAISMVMVMAPRMGMAKMEIVSMLSTMFGNPNRAIGWILQMLVGIKSGSVQAPGLWMTNNGGTMAVIGGWIGHMVFGLVVVLIYNLF